MLDKGWAVVAQPASHTFEVSLSNKCGIRVEVLRHGSVTQHCKVACLNGHSRLLHILFHVPVEKG